MFNKLFILNNQSKVREIRRYILRYIIIYMFASMQSKLYHRVNSD